MVEIQPIRVELEREEDGRVLASVPDLPGVMAYGASEEEAVRKVKSIALQVLADIHPSLSAIGQGARCGGFSPARAQKSSNRKIESSPYRTDSADVIKL